MDKQKQINTMRAYDEYEKRFAETRLQKEFYVPTADDDKNAIIADVKKMLSYNDDMLPTIDNMEELSVDVRDNYSVTQLRYATWENFYGVASLFMPHGEEKVPLVFVFPGHGAHGRLTNGYVSMANRLANMGIAVMLADNIGQGDREPQGHWNVISPFYCGLTLQGMILMESVALIRKMINHPRIDKTRVGACGNSGGGTLCLFLAALAPELSVLSSSGYPSDFSYILSKERPHCACNLLPGCAHGPEMWEILSAFAPKPLLIEQGKNDDLIPYDLFMRTARKLGHVYIQLGAENKFKYAHTLTTHPWVNNDRKLIADFLAKHLGITPVNMENDEDEELLKLSENWHVTLPDGSLDTDGLAEKLTGKKMPEGMTLADVYPPTHGGRPLSKDSIVPDIGRGDVMRILAQMECALKKY